MLALIADHGGSAADTPVALETDKNLLVLALRAAGFTVYPINPRAVARYRERHYQAGKKSDHGDASVLADILRTDRHQHRPHRALPYRATPATAYAARPKAGPGDSSGDAHARVRTDRIGSGGEVTLRYAGRLYSIGIGRTHARTRVLILIADLDIRIIDAATGELLRDLVLDPASATKAPADQPDHHPKSNKPEPTIVGSGYADVLRHHMEPRVGIEPTTFRLQGERSGQLS